jgi:hypothetical protein
MKKPMTKEGKWGRRHFGIVKFKAFWNVTPYSLVGN